MSTQPIAASYVSATQFTVSGDLRGEFAVGVKVQADCGADGGKIGMVTAASYGAPNTTVTISGDSLTANLTGVLHGNDTPESLANHSHEDADQGGVLIAYMRTDGSTTFTGGHVPVTGAYAGFKLIETGADTDEGKWIVQVNNGQMEILLANDTEDTFNSVLTVTRSGASPATITLTAPWIGVAGELAVQDNELSRPLFTDWAETLNARGSISGSQTLDLESGNVVTATITGATTFTFSNPPATGRAGGFVLHLTNGGAGTITWPAAVDWPGGTAPTLTASGVDILAFQTLDAGTTWRGVLAGKDVK